MRKLYFHPATKTQIILLSTFFVLFMAFLIFAFVQTKEMAGKYSLVSIMLLGTLVFFLITLKKYEVGKTVLQKNTIFLLRKETIPISQIEKAGIFPIYTSRPGSTFKMFVVEIELKNGKTKQFIFFASKNKDRFKKAIADMNIRITETQKAVWEPGIAHDLRILLN